MSVYLKGVCFHENCTHVNAKITVSYGSPEIFFQSTHGCMEMYTPHSEGAAFETPGIQFLRVPKFLIQGVLAGGHEIQSWEEGGWRGCFTV